MVERLGARLAWNIWLGDLGLTLVSLWVSSIVRVNIRLGYPLSGDLTSIPLQLYIFVTLIWTVIWLMLTPQVAVFADSLIEMVGRLVGAIALATLTMAGTLYLSYRGMSRLQFFYFAAIDLVLLLVFHVGVRIYTRSVGQKRWSRRVLMVGNNGDGPQLAREFERRWWTGVEVVGYTGSEALPENSLRWLGQIDDTLRVVADHAIDEVIFTLPPEEGEQVARLSLLLQQQPVMLHMVPSVLDLAFARTPVQTLGGIPLISLRESALTAAQRLFKRGFDTIGSVLLLIICSPLFLVIAIAIKLDSPGPVFFLQQRIGEYGRRFPMIKFRTMHEHAQEKWLEVAQRGVDGHLLHKRGDDPRVTRLGRKLRRSSLDEIPQLINVLRGDMSLVGPRPEIPVIAAEYEPWQWQRFRVPAGMTGWWQVNGRSDKPMHLHTEDDLYYIQNYSFWLDLKILWWTIGVVLRGQGAF